MPPKSDKLPQRKSPRLTDYDYSQNGAYFVTICTQYRRHLFGEITEQDMLLNEAGEMVSAYLSEIPNYFDSIEPDLFVVMPNHIHVILMKIVSEDETTISQIIQWFKRITTNQYIQGVKREGWRRFEKRLWQQSFHDHIIRNEVSLTKLREYVLYNPQLWKKDVLYGEE